VSLIADDVVICSASPFLLVSLFSAGWPRAVNSGIDAALRLKIGAGDMDEVDSSAEI
jgi:hypothetical protein